MDPVLAPFGRALEGVVLHAPRIPIVANLTGEFADASLLARPGYWTEHLRRPVRFADGMRTLAESGITHFVEIGPHPVLLGIGAACVRSPSASWTPSLRRDGDPWATLIDAAQSLYTAGVELDWDAFDAPGRYTVQTLPTYPFRSKRYWMDSLGIIPGDAARNAAANRSALAPITQTSALHATSFAPASTPHSPTSESTCSATWRARRSSPSCVSIQQMRRRGRRG
jgi:acyl transferase domain-containing protein